MEHVASLPKREADAPSVVTCKLCLAPESEMRLSFRNLSEFYTVFKPCGLGLNILESTHYNWVCVYCWTRTSQCLQFVEMARRVEYIVRNVLQNEKITEEKLKEASEGYIRRAVNLSPCIINDAEEVEFIDDDTFDTPTASVQPNDVTVKYLISESDNNDDFSKCKPAKKLEADLQPLQTDREDMGLEEHDTSEDTSRHLVEQVWMFCKEDTERAEKKSEQAQMLSGKEQHFSRDDKQTAHKAKRPQKNSDRWRNLHIEALNLSEEEQRAELAALRQTEKYRAWRYKCELCAVGYHEKDSIDRHNKRHDKTAGSYMCNICYGRYTTPHRLAMHSRTHRQRWRCLRCSETLNAPTSVEFHYTKCSGCEPLACAHCSKRFNTNLRLRHHVSKVHNSTSRFKCDICGRAFTQKQSMRNHIRTHTREKPYQCAICGKKFATYNNHSQHMSTHSESTEPKEERYCVECDRYYKTKHLLAEHLATNSKHAINKKFACSVCNKGFSTRFFLELHFTTMHVEKKDFSCNQCDKAFATEYLVKRHVRVTHNKRERPRNHACQVCGSAFMNRATLKMHIVGVHEMLRPYKCDICGATFGFKAALYTHNKLKHRGEKRTKKMSSCSSSTT